jgi:hypothetical protein
VFDLGVAVKAPDAKQQAQPVESKSKRPKAAGKEAKAAAPAAAAAAAGAAAEGKQQQSEQRAHELDMAVRLLMCGEKYQVPSLRAACETTLIAALSADNVCELLTLADRCSNEPLKVAWQIWCWRVLTLRVVIGRCRPRAWPSCRATGSDWRRWWTQRDTSR